MVGEGGRGRERERKSDRQTDRQRAQHFNLLNQEKLFPSQELGHLI